MIKLALTFILTSILAFGLTKTIVSEYAARQEVIDHEEADIIQEEIKERFNLFLDTSLVISQISAEYLNTKSLDSHYGQLVKKIFAERYYLLGLNRLDQEGNILATYPEDSNLEAKGKKTQNILKLIKSYHKGEEYWFSPPFKLFQGGYGFVFYVPIIQNKKLIGWIAPVISSELFFDRFKKMDYFSTYDLMIKDQETGLAYFSTAVGPGQAVVHKTTTNERGRDILIESWRKQEKQLNTFPWYLYFLISLLFSTIATVGVRFYQQKKQTTAQLNSISRLLRLTAKEALTKLVDIQSENLSLGSTGYLRTSIVEKDVQSITNLIEQIDLLQTMAEAEQVEEENFKVLPPLKEQIADLVDIIQKKNLIILMSEHTLENVEVTGNKWLFSNTVLKSCLTHCILYSVPNKAITITHISSPTIKGLRFHVQEVHETGLKDAYQLERKLLVARNTMSLFDGDIELKHDGSAGMDITVTYKCAT